MSKTQIMAPKIENVHGRRRRGREERRCVCRGVEPGGGGGILTAACYASAALLIHQESLWDSTFDSRRRMQRENNSHPLPSHLLISCPTLRPPPLCLRQILTEVPPQRPFAPRSLNLSSPIWAVYIKRTFVSLKRLNKTATAAGRRAPPPSLPNLPPPRELLLESTKNKRRRCLRILPETNVPPVNH